MPVCARFRWRISCRLRLRRVSTGSWGVAQGAGSAEATEAATRPLQAEMAEEVTVEATRSFQEEAVAL